MLRARLHAVVEAMRRLPHKMFQRKTAARTRPGLNGNYRRQDEVVRVDMVEVGNEKLWSSGNCRLRESSRQVRVLLYPHRHDDAAIANSDYYMDPPCATTLRWITFKVRHVHDCFQILDWHLPLTRELVILQCHCCPLRNGVVRQHLQ